MRGGTSFSSQEVNTKREQKHNKAIASRKNENFFIALFIVQLTVFFYCNRGIQYYQINLLYRIFLVFFGLMAQPFKERLVSVPALVV